MGPRAMLATTLDPARYSEAMDTAFAMETKIDGHRQLIETGPDGPHGFNRHGRRAVLPRQIRDAMAELTTPGLFDGELAQGVLWLFDCIEYGDGIVYPSMPWAKRNRRLRHLIDAWDPPAQIRLVDPFIREPDAKLAAIREIQRNGGEGVVFKRLTSPYTPGESTAWLKLKFLDDVDVVVVGQGFKDKANLVLAMADPSGDIELPGRVRGREVGRCSALTGDGPRVQVGDVVTVRIGGLGSSGRLVEPRTPRLRTDKAPGDCTIRQLATIRTISR